tara:strand:- start:90 stop:386 length:297 start_codon:yes stop_codon:yes gene_type:complete
MKIVKYIAAAILFTSASVGILAKAEETAKKDPMQMARGAKAWAQTCNRCHNIRAPKELTDEEWEVSATHMRVRANLPGDMVRDIIAFLQASNNERINE